MSPGLINIADKRVARICGTYLHYSNLSPSCTKTLQHLQSPWAANTLGGGAHQSRLMEEAKKWMLGIQQVHRPSNVKLAASRSEVICPSISREKLVITFMNFFHPFLNINRVQCLNPCLHLFPLVMRSLARNVIFVYRGKELNPCLNLTLAALFH